MGSGGAAPAEARSRVDRDQADVTGPLPELVALPAGVDRGMRVAVGSDRDIRALRVVDRRGRQRIPVHLALVGDAGVVVLSPLVERRAIRATGWRDVAGHA